MSLAVLISLAASMAGQAADGLPSPPGPPLIERLAGESPEVQARLREAWELAYKASAQFDDYRERYRSITKGIQVLLEGVARDPKEPRYCHAIGWLVAHRIGRADEAAQFRKLFAEDAGLHRRLIAGFDRNRVPGLGPRPDNWLVGRQWFLKAEQLVTRDRRGNPGWTSPVVFYSNSAICQMHYAEAIEREGIYGEMARFAWYEAERRCIEFGDIPLLGVEPGMVIRLNDKGKVEREVKTSGEDLDAMAPGLREAIRKERYASLLVAERNAYETPPEKRGPRDWELAVSAERKLRVTHEDVAGRFRGEGRVKALQIARKATDAEKRLIEIESQRAIVNFDYWRRRARTEQTFEALAARQSIYQGREAAAAGDLFAARRFYEHGFAQWRKLLDGRDGSEPKRDRAFGQELVEIIRQYRRILDQADEKFPRDFILQDVLDLHEKRESNP